MKGCFPDHIHGSRIEPGKFLQEFSSCVLRAHHCPPPAPLPPNLLRAARARAWPPPKGQNLTLSRAPSRPHRTLQSKSAAARRQSLSPSHSLPHEWATWHRRRPARAPARQPQARRRPVPSLAAADHRPSFLTLRSAATAEDVPSRRSYCFWWCLIGIQAPAHPRATATSATGGGAQRHSSSTFDNRYMCMHVKLESSRFLVDPLMNDG